MVSAKENAGKNLAEKIGWRRAKNGEDEEETKEKKSSQLGDNTEELESDEKLFLGLKVFSNRS